MLKISQNNDNRGRHFEFYFHTGIGNWFQCFQVYPGLNLSSGSGSGSGSRSGFRIPAFPYALFHMPIEFRPTALPTLGYPSVHFSAWPRFTYGHHFPVFPCLPTPPPPAPAWCFSYPFHFGYALFQFIRATLLHPNRVISPISHHYFRKPKKKTHQRQYLLRFTSRDAASEGHQVLQNRLRLFNPEYAPSKGKWCHPKSDFQWLWQAVHLSTKSAINKPAMNFRTILLAAVFHFVYQVEKDRLKLHKVTQNSVSSSYQLASFQTLHTFSAWTHLSNFDQSEHKNWT